MSYTVHFLGFAMKQIDIIHGPGSFIETVFLLQLQQIAIIKQS